jgi:hypothetical protein
LGHGVHHQTDALASSAAFEFSIQFPRNFIHRRIPVRTTNKRPVLSLSAAAAAAACAPAFKSGAAA